MNTITHQSTVAMTTIPCGNCGGVYAITTERHQQSLEHGESWTCPYCKTGWGFSGAKSPLALAQEKAERLEKMAQAIREGRDRARNAQHAAERSASAYRGLVTRIKNRVSNGVCPCCNRTFKDLARHMTTQHPDYSKETA